MEVQRGGMGGGRGKEGEGEMGKAINKAGRRRKEKETGMRE